MFRNKPLAPSEDERRQQARFARMLVESATVAPFFRDLLRTVQLTRTADHPLAA